MWRHTRWGGVSEMWLSVTRGGVKKSWNSCDVIYGWPLMTLSRKIIVFKPTLQTTKKFFFSAIWFYLTNTLYQKDVTLILIISTFLTITALAHMNCDYHMISFPMLLHFKFYKFLKLCMTLGLCLKYNILITYSQKLRLWMHSKNLSFTGTNLYNQNLPPERLPAIL